MLGVAGVFGGSFFAAMHGSLVTSSLIKETSDSESQNYGYKFGQEMDVIFDANLGLSEMGKQPSNFPIFSDWETASELQPIGLPLNL